MGGLFWRWGSPSDAPNSAASRESLDVAIALFDGVGARLWAEKGRVERDRISGRSPSGSSLTASEERIAGLVARGKTNREVAAELFVTTHTVEGALTRIYGKLGVRSRTELAGRFAQRQ
jgi:DNA-binding CsgD family transcriptional regulator